MKEFFDAIDKHAVYGFQQYYFIIAESTVRHFCGRWFYNSDGNFYEGTVFQMQSVPDSGIYYEKKCNWERLTKAVEDGYVTLFRVPKIAYKTIFPEQIIF